MPAIPRALELLALLQKQAQTSGASRLSLNNIDREIRAVRRTKNHPDREGRGDASKK